MEFFLISFGIIIFILAAIVIGRFICCLAGKNKKPEEKNLDGNHTK